MRGDSSELRDLAQVFSTFILISPPKDDGDTINLPLEIHYIRQFVAKYQNLACFSHPIIPTVYLLPSTI